MNHAILHNQAQFSLTSLSTQYIYEDAIYAASTAILAQLIRGQAFDRHFLSEHMINAFGATDAQGAWQWKDAYEAVEVAMVRFIQQFSPALSKMPAERQMAMLEKLHGFCPTHTRRSDESQAMQQFSTPLTIGLAAIIAADITQGEVVLEPSAGTGMLAVLAQMQGASLILNELSEARCGLLAGLFPETAVSRHNAEYIDDYLDVHVRPDV